MKRVLGVDPGSAATGWALVCEQGNRFAVEEHGVVRPRGEERSQRLAHLDRTLTGIVERLAPEHAAVESSFSGRNPKASLSLAESRGVVMAVLGRCSVPVTSFTPAEVKSAIVGHGRAEKQQIVFMVVRLLGLAESPPRDAADAMALALAYYHTRRYIALRRAAGGDS